MPSVLSPSFQRLFLIIFLIGVSPLNANPSGKLPAAGIFYLCGDEAAGNQSHFANQDCAGVSYRSSWNKIEPGDGAYDWSSIDSMLSAAHASHKAMGLGVAAGLRSPSWLGNSGVQMITWNLSRSFTADKMVTTPVMWDSTYQEKWGDFLLAMGKRYDRNPNLAYITISGISKGVGYEPFMARRPNDVQQFVQSGGIEKWIDASEHVIDLYAKAFPNTPFLLAMNNPVPTSDGSDALAKVVDYGLSTYPGRFGVMFHGLSAETSADDYFGRTIQDNSARTTVGFQMVWSTEGANASWLRGSLEQCLDQAVSLKTHFVEVYGQDCDNSSYYSLLTNINEKLTSR